MAQAEVAGCGPSFEVEDETETVHSEIRFALLSDEEE